MRQKSTNFGALGGGPAGEGNHLFLSPPCCRGLTEMRCDSCSLSRYHGHKGKGHNLGMAKQ